MNVTVDRCDKSIITGRERYATESTPPPSLLFLFLLPPSTPVPNVVAVLRWPRSNHALNINMLSHHRVPRFYQSMNHRARTRRARQSITPEDICQSRSTTPSVGTDIVLFENSGASFIWTHRFFLLISRNDHTILRWGHFSTVWLVKDSQSVTLASFYV